VDAALAPFLGSWTLMMAAMMLPSALPMILLHRRGNAGAVRIQSELRSGIFVGAYLLVWGASGVGVWLVARITNALLPMDARALAVAAILLLAGIYEFTPLKTACLRVCRSPADFLLTHWYPGLAGELRLGLEHGLYCLGCCWALMAVFVGAGAMGLLWAAIIAVVVFVEKVLPRGVVFGRVIGTALIAGAVLVAVRPEIAQFGTGKM
jgi:predicted metal-binding membrane protein